MRIFVIQESSKIFKQMNNDDTFTWMDMLIVNSMILLTLMSKPSRKVEHVT